MGEKDHHLFGPSQWWKRRNCPASAKEEKELPEVSTEWAEYGTRAHEYMDMYLREHLKGEHVLYPEVDSEVKRFVRAGHDELVDFLGEHADALESDKGGNYAIETEHRVGYPDLYYGWSDVVMVFQDSVVVADWKFGWQEVDEENAELQLAGYLEPCLAAYDKPVGRAIMFAPRLDQRFTLRLARDDRKVEAFAKQLIDNCDAYPDKYESGPWCKHCKALGVCPATEGQLEEVGEILPATVDVVKKLSVDRLEPIAAKIKPAIAILEAAWKRIREIKTEDPTTFPDLKLITRRGSRRVTDYGAVRALALGLLPKEAVDAISSISVPELEAAIKRAVGEGADSVFESVMGEFIDQSSVTYLRGVRRKRKHHD